MKNGRISWIGKYEEIEESNISDLLKFMNMRKLVNSQLMKNQIKKKKEGD